MPEKYWTISSNSKLLISMQNTLTIDHPHHERGQQIFCQVIQFCNAICQLLHTIAKCSPSILMQGKHKCDENVFSTSCVHSASSLEPVHIWISSCFNHPIPNCLHCWFTEHLKRLFLGFICCVHYLNIPFTEMLVYACQLPCFFYIT